MEEAIIVENLENKMKKTDERLDNLAIQVGNIENEIFSNKSNNDNITNDELGANIEVNNLLKSVNEVKNNYQNLRQELLEVQDLQKQLSSSLQSQLKLMHKKFHILKEKIQTNVPPFQTTNQQFLMKPNKTTLNGNSTE